MSISDRKKTSPPNGRSCEGARWLNENEMLKPCDRFGTSDLGRVGLLP